MRSIFLKIKLYILSLTLLFVCFIILNFKLSDSFDITNYKSWLILASDNILSIFSLFMLAYNILILKYFNYLLEGSTDIPFEITKIENINHEHIAFLTTYIIPLISLNINLDNIRQILMAFFLLFVTGIIYIKTNLFYANPILAIFGFYIYRADGLFKNGERKNIILLSKQKIDIGEKVPYMVLDEKVYFVRRSKYERRICKK